MQLKVLGALALEGSTFARYKPLLLLAYLAMEGPKSRSHLAEFIWAGAADPRDSLSTTLRRLRSIGPELVGESGNQLHSGVACDAVNLLQAAAGGDDETTARLYKGPFLGDASLKMSVELEEWVFGTRERVALAVRTAMLRLASVALAAGNTSNSRALAERAFAVAYGPVWEDEALAALIEVLERTGSDRLRDAVAEAASLRISLSELVDEDHRMAKSVPYVTTSFHGRDPELTLLNEFLSSPYARLVTLHGAGGVGKTRLALEAAHRLADAGRFPGGTYFVALDGLVGSETVANTIVKALQFSGAAQGSAEDAVVQAVGHRKLLLVLDNFEHLFGARSLLARLVAECPEVRVLVTSRHTLNLAGEHVLRVYGLPFQGDEQEPEALTLFLSRLWQNGVTVDRSPPERAAALQVCRLVEGNPLALELAAGSARVVPLATIASRLGLSGELLVNRESNAHPRHRSMRAALEVSWHLMSEEQRVAMAALSVFSESFEQATALTVAGVSVSMLASLTDASMVRFRPSGKFDLHPLIQQYAAEQFERLPGAAAVKRAHAEHFLSRVGEAGHHLLHSVEGRAAGYFLDQEMPNVASAWRWSLENGQPALIERAAWALSHLGETRGRYNEVIPMLDAAVEALAARGEEPDAQRALGSIRAYNSFLLFRVGQIDRAIAEGDSALVLLEPQLQHSGNWGLWSAYQGLAMAHLSASKPRQAREYLRLGAEIAAGDSDNAAGDPELKRAADVSLGITLQTYAFLDAHAGEHTSALEWLSAARSRFEPHSAPHLSYVYWLTGKTYAGIGVLEQASWWLQRALGFAREAGFETMVGHAMDDLTRVQLRLGDVEAALAVCETALPAATASGDRWLQTSLLAAKGMAVLAAGNTAAAQELFRESLQVAQTFGGHRFAMDALLGMAEIELGLGRVSRAVSLLEYLINTPLAPKLVATRAGELLQEHGRHPAGGAGWVVPADEGESVDHLADLERVVSLVL